jgi:hypothetical protein
MTETEPLHVRVARVLGTLRDEESHERDEAAHGQSVCTLCGQFAPWGKEFRGVCAPNYAEDWAATGPLLVKYRIGISPFVKAMDPPKKGEAWAAAEPVSGLKQWGADPLVCACHLILALHAAGKLE